MNPRLRAMARTGVRVVNHPVAKRRITRTLADAARPIKLEIGGTAKRPGWVVTNVSALARNYLDATVTWPLEDDSVEFVYADNVIEHIPLAAGRAMLAEAKRCLRPGGVIRLVTPDIRHHIELYLSGADPLASPAGKHYASMGLTVEHPLDLVRIPIGEFGHHSGYVYDPETLGAELERAGFSQVTRCELGESDHAALAGLDQRSGSERAQMAIEATA
ncbi:methyltransferase domain-containing protein [Nocardioides sp. AE5]|uniref:class I SAM-dependent methyltransferase n=1 Tax=Nocardioides sp. AE5 TaxID=2962573 RepID=UPI002881B3EF|nr:methyltransferase domain-containing protein [Nocardioides sp. AE5]MDT0202567.1 methyltransferase domain-containing protein [Nocardioides sp. AE5]